MKTIDFKKNPYRGIMKEIADMKGVSKEAVRQSYKRKNPETVRYVETLIKKRNREMEEIEKKLTKAERSKKRA